MNTTIVVQFKQIINNIVIRKGVFDHVKRINRLLKSWNNCYKWVDIYSSFNLLVQFGYLNELKYRLENEGIDSDLYKLYNSTANNNEKKDSNEHRIDQKKTKEKKNKNDKLGEEEIDHRIIGLSRIACEYGHLKIVEYLNQHHQSRYAFSQNDMYHAIRYGHQEIAEYLFDNRSEGYDDNSIKQAAIKGYNQLLDKMLERWKKGSITFGYVHSIDTLHIIHKYTKHGLSENTTNGSIERGDLEMVKFINDHYPTRITKNCLLSMTNEHLDIFKYLINNNSNIKGEEYIEYAARTGQLDLLKELIQLYPNQLNHPDLMKSQHVPILEYLKKEHAMVLNNNNKREAYRRNLELIKYYHENGVDLDDAMEAASQQGKLDIIKYLHYNVPGIVCTPEIMDIAASHGNLEMVEFLHQHRTEGCTINAMTDAIRVDDINVVKFLHQHRTEGYDPDVVDIISLEMIEFLHRNRTEQLNYLRAMELAIEYPDLDLAKYIHHNLPHIPQIPLDPFEKYEYHCHSLEIVEFLVINGIDLMIDFSSTSNEILKYLVDKHIDMIPDDKYDYRRNIYDVERVHLKCRIFKHRGIEPTVGQWSGLESLESIKYLRLFTQYRLSPDRLLDNACRASNLALIDYLLSCYPSIKIESHLDMTKKNVAINTYLKTFKN